jgi:paraquat-inducible protein B
MSAKATKLMVGGFIVSAMVLAVAGLILFGGGQYFQDKVFYVLYFQGSAAGLGDGSNVLLKGVKFGAVTDVHMVCDPVPMTFQTRVIIETYPESLVFADAAGRQETLAKAGGDLAQARKNVVQMLIQKGLRAQLASQSMLTGQLQVVLDFHPETPIRLVGDSEHTELPTIPSSIEQLRQSLQELPLKDIVTKVDSILTRLDEVLRSPAVKETVTEAARATKELGNLLAKVNEKSEGLLDDTKGLIDDLRSAARNVDGKIGPLASDVEETTRKLVELVEQARKTVAALEIELRSDSALFIQARVALESFAGAMRAIRDLGDYLERHPESVLQGKSGG